jgi:adenine deaminase
MESFEIEGQVVDVDAGSIYPGSISVEQGKISKISKLAASNGPFLIPGFIDAHVHIESSMLIPSEFARLAVVHGTVATVSDPHEIGNVLGIDGVYFMVENGKEVNFKCYFGAPSCVPATLFETSGATINSNDIDSLLSNSDIKYLAEMMNWPGVLNADKEVIHKIQLAHKFKKPVDGHAPGLRGEEARIYASAGITTDHECFTLEEALDKLAFGMHIIIREGSAARNFDALIPLLPEYADKMMFCSDDKHPDSLLRGHINLLAQRAVAIGIDPLTVLKVACQNPVRHYGLDVGLLKEGDPADFLVVRDLKEFKVLETYISGQLVCQHGQSLLSSVKSNYSNNFHTDLKKTEDFQLKATGKTARVMVAKDGQLVTTEKRMPIKIVNGLAFSDTERDVLKIVVVNRYHDAPPAIAFIRNFGLQEGAIASSVAHDSHNIIAVGVDDHSICEAVNEIISHKGGVTAISGSGKETLPLPVAGLMSPNDGYWVAEKYISVDAMAKSLGSKLEAPFMTLSFMALLVIPELKLSDRGLFNSSTFEFIPLFED